MWEIARSSYEVQRSMKWVVKLSSVVVTWQSGKMTTLYFTRWIHDPFIMNRSTILVTMLCESH
ncbi:unnamed protein product [Spirodela intermedia]|uniref:Uncharacterized protein n=1 Tax=Spirodela intermedia TaxID=51605 RepID=A0A7I8KBU9_SPIIN|nr:unnamed protein product [Spirodela intermedia]